MAYDRELKENIDKMKLGDLVHYMMITYDKTIHGDGPYMQSTGYFWAYERLQQLSEKIGEKS